MHSAIEIRSQITNQIIDALSLGSLLPWRKPWSNDKNAPGLHTSLSSRNSYRGINQLILQLSAMKQNHQSKWWGTFKQIKSCGGSVCSGAKGTHIVLYKPIARTSTDEYGKEKDNSFYVLKTFVVFNADQTTGLDRFRVGFAQPAVDETERYEHADAVIESVGADIRFGGNKAFYSVNHDFIQCPFRHQFVSPEAYYETMFHELCHWSEKRTDFDRTRPENTYGFAELVAEIGACFLLAELGLPTLDNLTNSSAYLKSWLTGMNGDPAFIFKASSLASKAVEFVLSFSRTTEPVLDLEEAPF